MDDFYTVKELLDTIPSQAEMERAWADLYAGKSVADDLDAMARDHERYQKWLSFQESCETKKW